MSLADSSAAFINRLGTNAPQIATMGYSLAYGFALSNLSAYDDGNFLLTSNTSNLSVLSASGAALDLLGAGANVYRNLGTPAILLVQFSVAAAVTGSALVIQAGAQVATQGDNVSTFSVAYTTLAAATISVGQTLSTVVLAQAQVNGSNANVASGSIVLLQTNYSGVTVTNNPSTPVNYPVPTSTTTVDSYGQILGTDIDSDAIYRRRILAALTAKYAVTAITNAINAVTLPEQLTALNDTAKHAYSPDAVYVYDPGITGAPNASGAVYYFWCLADGSTPGLSGGSQVTTGNQVWTLTIPAGNTTGTYTITYLSASSGSVAWNGTLATAQSQLQTGMNTLFGTNNVVVSLPTGTGPWTVVITAQHALANTLLGNLVITPGTLTGSPTLVITTPGGFDGVNYVSNPTLTDYALLVDSAVRAVCPANLVPRIGATGSVNSPFSVVHVTSMAAKILWPSNVQINGTTFLDASSTIVRQGLQQYIQSLTYNTVPTVYGAASYVTSYCALQNVPLLSVILTAVNGTNIVTSPLTPGTATAPSIYVSTYSDITPTQILTNANIVLSQGSL